MEEAVSAYLEEKVNEMILEAKVTVHELPTGLHLTIIARESSLTPHERMHIHIYTREASQTRRKRYLSLGCALIGPDSVL